MTTIIQLEKDPILLKNRINELETEIKALRQAWSEVTKCQEQLIANLAKIEAKFITPTE